MKLVAPFVVLLVALALTVHLDDTPAEADLVLVNNADVFTLDPQRQSYIHDFRMTYALFEGLVRWNTGDFSIEPAAADLPEISPDRLTYTFRLRADGRWSNGDPVTAGDFVYAWQRLLLPETAADYSNLLFCIDGAEAFWHWRAAQLAGFAADPWSAPADRRADHAAGMVGRLQRLLAAASLPSGIAPAPVAGIDRDAVGAELDAITAAAGRTGGDVEPALQQATRTRAWVDDLSARASRRAEARWMWHEALGRFEQTVGLRALDRHTLQVRLARPTAYLLELACLAVCAPVHRPCVEGWPVEWHGEGPPPADRLRWVRLDPRTGRLEQRHQWARPGRLVSNGPYQLAAWRYKRDMRLERNPHYHSPQRVRSDSVVVRTIGDANTRVLAFESGGVHWLSTVGAEYQADMIAQRRSYEQAHAGELAGLLASGLSRDDALTDLPPPGPDQRRTIHVVPAFGTDFYSFNCRPRLADGRANPFHDARVRRAFVMSVDKQAIVRQATRLDEPVISTLIPPGSIPGYRGPAGLPSDPVRARAEFADAGWIDRDGDGLVENARGEPFPVIDLLWTTGTPRYKWISLALKSQWEQALGVRLEMRPTDTKFFKEDLKQGKFMIARGRWYGDYGDPTTFLDLCRTGDGNNDRGYSSPVVDDLLERAAGEPDPQRRLALLRGLSHHPRLVQYLWQMEAVEP
jgi:ABC-type oligopeptide transport system substrate-binding subunit